MSLHETMMNVEEQIVNLDCARAVLGEAKQYFDMTIEHGSAEAHYLVSSAERIGLLLIVADRLIFDTLPELHGAVDALCVARKEEREAS